MLWAESAAPDGGCSSGQVRYHRREPEHTVLHQLVREYLASFLAETAERYPSGELPPFIQGEFERYLSCGILEHGFARVRCSSCRDELLVAFSCKNRGVCPSCSARRMADTAAHLRAQVFPEVPLRQWVCTMPKRLRFLLAWKPKLISLALTLFLRALFAWQRRCARKQGIKGPLCGAVTFIQRFGSALNVNIHFHTLVPEGVFFQSDQGGIGFHALLPPSVSDLNKLLRRIILSLLKRLATQSALEEADAWMQTLAQSVRTATGPISDEPPGGLCAFAEGFSLHAGVSVDKSDGEGRERLARYCARPCLSLERLSIDSDGQVLYSLKRTAPGAPAVLTLSPTEFLAKLAALIPPPRSHLVRYHGVFSPHCRQRCHRARVQVSRGHPFVFGPRGHRPGCDERPAAKSLHGRSHEGATTPAASAALWQRLLCSAASGTNQAPTALTAAAALLFSAHDGTPPAGEAPPAGEPGAGHELVRSRKRLS